MRCHTIKRINKQIIHSKQPYMKAYLTLAIGLAGIAGLGSCTKEYYSPPPNKTFIYTITTNDWVWDEGVLNQVYHDIGLPELGDYYMDQGLVNVAISMDGEASYEILPATIAGTSYSVNYSTGRVTIYAEDPIFDPEYEVPIPSSTITVKITLSEADFIP